MPNMFNMMSESEFESLRRLRQLEFYSPHLTVIDVSNIRNYEKKITDWIWQNTKGRFWVGDNYSDNVWKFLVGFEIPYEATYFSLKFFASLDNNLK